MFVSRLSLFLTAGLLLMIALLPASVRAEIVVLEPVADNSMYEEDGTLSNGAGIYLFIGVTDENFLRRALLLFDIAGSLPAEASITDASLSFNVDREPRGGAPDGLASLHRSEAAWGEEGSDAEGAEGRGAPADPGDATWTFRTFNTVRWVDEGGELIQPVTATSLISGLGEFAFTGDNLLRDVQDMYAVPATNFGWILLGDESQIKTARRLGSRENTRETLRPKLTITYEPKVPTENSSVGRLKSAFDE